MIRARPIERLFVLGICGAQGSGKSTLVAALADRLAREGIAAAMLSLDDLYRTRAERQALAQGVHPLFATRGPPGTHNLLQFNETLDELLEAGEGAQTFLPAFDKVTDNPIHAARKPVFRGKPSAILVDGWCLGATQQAPEQLAIPINDLEAREDAASVWRREINDNLAGAYQHAFARLDAILYLRAPSFAVIQDWRCQQEEGLLGRALNDADRQRVARFIAHFERVSRHMMDGGRRADIEVQLDDRRNVTEVKHIPSPSA